MSSLSRARLLAYAVGSLVCLGQTALVVADLERWWDRGPAVRAFSLVAFAVSFGSLGATVGVHWFATRVRRGLRG